MLPARRVVTYPAFGPHSQSIGHAFGRGTIASFERMPQYVSAVPPRRKSTCGPVYPAL